MQKFDRFEPKLLDEFALSLCKTFVILPFVYQSLVYNLLNISCLCSIMNEITRRFCAKEKIMLFQDLDKIVFAGDSVTDHNSVKPVGDDGWDSLGFGYVRQVENMLVAWYPELNIRVVNSGISGNTSRDLLQRFERDVTSLNPQWVSICIGFNDVWRQFDSPNMPDRHVLPDEYKNNVEQMILQTKNIAKGVFVLSPYYVEPLKQDAMRAKMDEYVAICKHLAQKHGCVFVDLQAMFDEFCKVQHSARVSWDRVHPNQMAATMIAKAFLKSADFDFSK